VAKQKKSETLPKTAALCAQWVRCGKPGCRCAGGELHGPYAYVFFRLGGRLRKRYVRVGSAQAVAAAMQAQQAQRGALRGAWSDFRGVRDKVREVTHGPA